MYVYMTNSSHSVASESEKARELRLLNPATKKSSSERKSKADAVSWKDVDKDLFEELRAFRRQIAEERHVAPFIIFSDASLRELSLHRPTTLANFRLISGVGEKKTNDFGPRFTEMILKYCSNRNLRSDLWK